MTPLYTPAPQTIAASQLTAFTRRCQEATGQTFASYAALHAFSLREWRRFWDLFVDWSQLPIAGERSPVCEGDLCETAVFYPRARLSYAYSLLRCESAEDAARPALSALTEEGQVTRLSRGELLAQVRAAATALAALGVKSGDRVVAIARNTAESLVACLAAATLGASWSATSPDLGTEAILGRFAQLAPKVLFFHASYPYHGARRAIAERVSAVAQHLPSLTALIPLDEEGAALPAVARAEAAPLTPTSPLHALAAAVDPAALCPFTEHPFNHPLFILFSSGTTGVPKCIVHGAGGTLLEHHKEHRLHCDLQPGDKLYFQTSCGWMMWNWLVSALACRAEIVLYDGSVSFPEEDSLWRLVSSEGVTHLGTSPAYLQYTRDAGIVPRERVALPALRAILSTGSILPDALYPFALTQIKAVPLQSISGGTDIIGCFVLGNPNLPVYAGESQCISLGMDVRALPEGASIDNRGAAAAHAIGELTCHLPFPSRPLGLYGDPQGRRFHDAYFSQHPGVWTHGDFLELTPRGTARIHGRSDGVMNIRGIRIGPAEIYHALSGVGEVAEAMAIEQAKADEPGGSRLVLLVVLQPGQTLERALTLRIKKELSQRCSMAHVPGVIAQVSALPTTHSGKRSERAARDVLNGRTAENRGALRNPECLDELATHPALAALAVTPGA